MVALNVGSRENVEKVYRKAIELGGADEGAPGERGPGFFGGYFRDLDGNKFVAFTMG
jgi:predicted lactoylglutathione lyase